MDWKEILAQKVEAGEIEREEFVEAPSETAPEADIIEVAIDRKGRKGKTATIAAGFTCDENRLREIASVLKQRIGTGGSARGGEILIQGEHLREVADHLRILGYKVK